MYAHKLGFIALAAVLLVTAALAQDHAHHDEDATAASGIGLSPELRQLLVREMLAIQEGMQDLVPAIAAGRWAEIAATGRKIHDSYILRQEMSEAQLEELHHALPAEFVEMDHAFHHTAGMLAHAAEQKNADVVGFYFFKLNEGCVACHAKFAAERFPGLAPAGEHEGHH